MPEGAQVVVADSASTDGSMNMLSVRFPSVKQIRLDRNYGFTGGYNRAFKELCAMEESAGLEYFVLINSDVEVTPGWLEPLVQWMDRHPDCAACGPKIRSYSAKDRFEYAGAAGGCLDRFGYPFCRGRVLKRVEKDLAKAEKDLASVTRTLSNQGFVAKAAPEVIEKKRAQAAELEQTIAQLKAQAQDLA